MLPDIVLLTLDTTRADHLGCYGYPRDTSPHLDRLPHDSIVFEQHIVPMSTTLPSHVALFTATNPGENGVRENLSRGETRALIPEGLESFAEVAKRAGLSTAAFISAVPLKRGSGIGQGFQHFDQPRGHQRRAGETIDQALEWLASVPGERPFFLWVHLFDPHFPYDPPLPPERRFQLDDALRQLLSQRGVSPETRRPVDNRWVETFEAVDGYDGEIRYMDSQLGRLLDSVRARPRWEQTAVVVVGDHGESLGQHGVPYHGHVWGEQLRAPLMLRIPGRSPRRVEQVVSTLDVFPTLLGQLPLPGAQRWVRQGSGRDVLAGEPARAVVSWTSERQHRYGLVPAVALTTEAWKLVRLDGGGLQLYDRLGDPHELTPVQDREPEVVSALVRELEGQLDRTRRRARRLRPRTEPADAELIEELRALGYVGDDS